MEHQMIACSGMPEVIVTPNEALVDEKLAICVKGLRKHQTVTLHASLAGNGTTFESCASYVADIDGTVNVTEHAAIHGTYTGVEPMGLFWSMRSTSQQRKGSRITHKDVSVPLETQLYVLSGQYTLDQIKSQNIPVVTKTTCLRWYKTKSVTRHAVRGRKIRGALFLPEGTGPFPGIIDLFGVVGGLLEFRASLLATKGFATLALAYMGYDDLPPHFQLDLSYFQEAVDWLTCHKKVNSSGVGVIGVSKGGETALVMSAHLPKVKAVVSINGPPFYMVPSIRRPDDTRHNEDVEVDVWRVKHTDEGIVNKNSYEFSDESLIEVWKRDAKILTIVGEDDQCLNPSIYQRLLNRLPQEKRDNMEIVYYPGAGHIIEPPYMPLYRTSYSTILMTHFVWGGSPKPHAEAQEDSWKRIQQFFHKHLQNDIRDIEMPKSKL